MKPYFHAFFRYMSLIAHEGVCFLEPAVGSFEISHPFSMVYRMGNRKGCFYIPWDVGCDFWNIPWTMPTKMTAAPPFFLLIFSPM